MGLFKRRNSAASTAVEQVASENTAASSPEGLSEELVAVISAAIASYEGESAAATNLIIRKIDRTAGVIPAWGVAGNREQIDTRRM